MSWTHILEIAALILSALCFGVVWLSGKIKATDMEPTRHVAHRYAAYDLAQDFPPVAKDVIRRNGQFRDS